MTKKGMAQLLQVLMDDYAVLKRRLARHPWLVRRCGRCHAGSLFAFAADGVRSAGSASPNLSISHCAQYRGGSSALGKHVDWHARRSNSCCDWSTMSSIPSGLRRDDHPCSCWRRRSKSLRPRRRAIFVAARLEGIPYPEIAARFGISTRYLERELKQALDHCRERLEIKLSKKFGPDGSDNV